MLSSARGRSVGRRARDINNNECKDDEVDYDDNLVRLSLNKPRRWGWELTTSSSSPHIAFPKIQLYDSKTDKLLVEAEQPDCVYQGNEQLERQWICGEEVPVVRRSYPRSHSSSHNSTDNTFPLTRSKSTSSKNALIAESEAIIQSLKEQLNQQGIDCNVRNRSRSVSRARSIARDFDPIPEELELNKIEPVVAPPPPGKDTKVNFLQPPSCLKKSKSATDVIPSPARPYSRSSSSVRFTSSFLQRMSERKEDESSSDGELETRDRRYLYRSSKAGTLLICESDNTNKTRRRRRSRNLGAVDEANEQHTNKTTTTNAPSIEKCDQSSSNQLSGANKRNERVQRNPISLSGSSNNPNYRSCQVLPATVSPPSVLPRPDLLPCEKSLTICQKSNHGRRSASVGCRTRAVRENQSIGLNSSSEDDDDDNDRSTSKRIKTPRVRKQPAYRPLQSHSSSNIALNEDKINDCVKDNLATINKRSNNNNKTSRGQEDTVKAISPLAIDSVNSDEVLFHLVKRLASLKQHHPTNRQKSTDLNLLNKSDHEYLLDDKELLNKLRYSATVADLCDQELSNNNFVKNKSPISSPIVSKKDETRFVVKDDECDCDDNQLDDTGMGSNVSRFSDKGLSGRRTQSSGDLCNGSTANTTPKKTSKKERKARQVAAAASSNFSNIDDDTSSIATTTAAYDNASFKDPCLVNDISVQHLYSPYNTRKHYGSPARQAYHGSLPNNLDTDDVDGVLDQQRAIINSYNNGDNNKDAEAYVTGDQLTLQCTALQAMGDGAQLQLQHQQYQLQNSPYNNSSSGKGSSISSANNLGSNTFRGNQDPTIKDHPFHIPLQRNLSNVDTGYDQGYGSERSPEDELPPSLPLIDEHQYLDSLQNFTKAAHQNYQQQTSAMPFNYTNILEYTQLYQYDFITKDTIFPVYIAKGPRGLGLSVSGGVDSNAPFPGLIRIKRLFPHQAAWSTGVLQQGDILLAVNGVLLTGLSNYEALEVLRTTPNEVYMVVCRPHDERYRKLSPPAEPPLPPQRSFGIEQCDPSQSIFCGEFEIVLTKQQGSLGFTLRKEDESILGHCVRALVREPALSDGRIKPGDKILAVNDIPISNMTHEQAVIFMRQASDVVKLRLFRDGSVTPITAASPTDATDKTILTASKRVVLRPEAINLLTDIAYRKQQSGGDDSTSSSQKSSSASPRRLRRAQKSSHSSASHSSSNNPFIHTGSENTDSDTSTVVSQDNTCLVQPVSSHSSITFSNNGVVSEPEEEFYNEDELLEMVDQESYYGERPNRPSYLDLAGQEGSTPVVSRKPQFQFTIAATNAYELNNLDNEVLDAPTIYTLSSSSNNGNDGGGGGGGSCTTGSGIDEFTSLPCETLLVACKSGSDLEQYVSKFRHTNPAYQSAQYSSSRDSSSVNNASGDGGVGFTGSTGIGGGGDEDKKDDGGKSLLKWKGVMLSPDKSSGDKTPSVESCCDVTVISNPNDTMTNSNCSLNLNQFTTDGEGNQIITVELNRGWNSRLGFSISQDPDTNKITISAIYEDSVAARDGRLKTGDQILAVNEESIDGMSKNDIIDLLRIIRGSILITVLRKEQSCTNIINNNNNHHQQHNTNDDET